MSFNREKGMNRLGLLVLSIRTKSTWKERTRLGLMWDEQTGPGNCVRHSKEGTGLICSSF